MKLELEIFPENYCVTVRIMLLVGWSHPLPGERLAGLVLFIPFPVKLFKSDSPYV